MDVLGYAKASGREPYAYLRHIFAELPKATTLAQIEALLPANVDPASFALVVKY
jgi:transposase